MTVSHRRGSVTGVVVNVLEELLEDPILFTKYVYVHHYLLGGGLVRRRRDRIINSDPSKDSDRYFDSRSRYRNPFINLFH